MHRRPTETKHEFFTVPVPHLSPYSPLGFRFVEDPRDPGTGLGDLRREQVTVYLALLAGEAALGWELPFPVGWSAPSLVARSRVAPGPARPRVELSWEHKEAELARGVLDPEGDMGIAQSHFLGDLDDFGRQGDPAPPSDSAHTVGFEALCLLARVEAGAGAYRALAAMFSGGFPAYVASANPELGSALEAALAGEKRGGAFRPSP
jgi:hypothetical protein